MEKSKELTPMQEAKKQIAELWSSPSDQPTYSQIFEILESLLPKEKQGYEDAFNNGLNCQVSGATGEEYYNTKYKNYEIR